MTRETIKPGDTCRFGPYDWFVLSLIGYDALLITLDIVELLPYNIEFSNATWEDCSMRKYLNEEFLCRFTEDERGRIFQTINDNDNPTYQTRGGIPTTDKVFLLSIQEAVYYFADNDNQDRVARYNNSPTWWWLRSPGALPATAAGVYSDGLVDLSGIAVGAVGGVRPALRVRL